MLIATRTIKIKPDPIINPSGDFSHMIEMAFWDEEKQPESEPRPRSFLLYGPKHHELSIISEDGAKDIAMRTLFASGSISKPDLRQISKED